MNHYQVFTETILRELRAVFDGSAEVEYHQLPKNNCELQDALCILPHGQKLAPVIYLRPYFEEYCGGRTLTDLLAEMVQSVRKGEGAPYSVEGLEEWKNVRGKIGGKLIAASGNDGFLESVPHRIFLDMALVYFLYFDPESAPAGTAVVSMKNMELWGVTEEELYEQSRKNLPELLPPRIYNMEEMLREMLCGEAYQAKDLLQTGEDPISGNLNGMYVVTNSRRWLGAAALFYDDVLAHFLDQMGWEEVYVIPSSIHEMLLVPASVAEESSLMDIICEVNDTSVEKEERLTYSLYRYSRKTGCLTRAAGKSEDLKTLYAVAVA